MFSYCIPKCVPAVFRMRSLSNPYWRRKGGGNGVLIAFVLCFKCMHIVIILEEEEEEQGRGNECI